MSKNNRRKFDPEFKEEAVKLLTEQGYMISEAVRNLESHENLLGRRKRELRDFESDSLSGYSFSSSIKSRICSSS